MAPIRRSPREATRDAVTAERNPVWTRRAATRLRTCKVEALEAASARGAAQASEDALHAHRCVQQYGLLAGWSRGERGVACGMGVWKTIRVAL